MPSESDRRVVLPGTHSPLDPERALKTPGRVFTKDEVRQIQRDRLIDAFVQVCAGSGYETAGVKSTCRAAGVAYNTFYDHFETKEELFLAAYNAGVDGLFQFAVAAWRDAGALTWSEQVEVAIGAILDCLDQNPAFACFFVVEAGKAGPVGFTRINELMQLAPAAFGRAIPRAGLKMNTEEVIALMVGGMRYVMVSAINAGKTGHLMELHPLLTEYALYMLEGME